LHEPGVLDDYDRMIGLFYENEFISDRDSEADKALFVPLFRKIIVLMGKPFFEGAFDFGNDEYFESVYALSESIYKNKDVRSSNHARGNRHALYINRTYLGLYVMLHDLRAQVITRSRNQSWKMNKLTQ
jgi:hypothetical protein